MIIPGGLAAALAVTMLAGMLGGYLGYRSRVPGGPLIGSLICVCALNVLTDGAQSLPAYKIAAQTIAGIFIGMQLGKCDLRQMLRLWKPVLVIIIGMSLINILSALMVTLSSDVDGVTAMFATTPGGIAEMSIMAGEMNANGLQVSVLQFARLIFSLCVFPSTAGFIVRKIRKSGVREAPEQRFTSDKAGYSPRNTAVVLLAATACGLIGYTSRITGAMLFLPMLAVAALGQMHVNARLHFNCKRVAQMLSGICIGAGITQADVLGLPTLIVPIVLVLLVYFVLCLALGFILYRLCKLDPSAAFFSCIPAGVSDMALIASDFGTGGPVVAVLQLCRFSAVVFGAPTLISLVAPLLP